MFRDRLSRKASYSQDNDQIALARLYKKVLGSPEGLLLLDHIVNDLCRVDDVHLVADPMLIVDANARRNVGITIARLVLSPLDDQEKPEVKA